VPTIIINETKIIFKTAISILKISSHNSFRVLFGKIASVYFISKYIYISALDMASPGNHHCAYCIRTLLFPMNMNDNEHEFIQRIVINKSCTR